MIAVNSYFVEEVDYPTISAALREVAPRCAHCHHPKLQLCIEQCCRPNALYCQQCDCDEHFLHRSNHLWVLFLDVKKLNKESRRKYFQLDICVSMGVDPTWRMNEMELNRHLRLSLQEINALPGQGWHSNIQQSMRQYLISKASAKDTQEKLRADLQKFNEAFAIDERMSRLQEIVGSLKYLVNPNKHNILLGPWLQSIRSRFAIYRIDRILVDTCHQAFVDEDNVIHQNCLRYSNRLSRNIRLTALVKGGNKELNRKRLIIQSSSKNEIKKCSPGNLDLLCPQTRELWLNFLPKSFPEGLERLDLQLSIFPINNLDNLPRSLKYLTLSTPSSDNHLSDLMVSNIMRLPHLQRFELQIGSISIETLEHELLANLKYDKRTVMIWPLLGSKWAKECMKEFDIHQHRIRLGYRGCLLQAICLHRNNRLRNMYAGFRDALLVTLAA